MAKKKNIKDAVIAEEKDIESKKAKKEETEVEEIETEEEIEELDGLEDVEEYIDEKESKKKKDKKEKDKEKDKDKDKKEGFFSGMTKEMKKVSWPSFGSVMKYTFAVIIFCLILGLFFEGMNLLAAFIKGLFN